MAKMNTGGYKIVKQGREGWAIFDPQGKLVTEGLRNRKSAEGYVMALLAQGR